jgi:hypothetical protein
MGLLDILNGMPKWSAWTTSAQQQPWRRRHVADHDGALGLLAYKAFKGRSGQAVPSGGMGQSGRLPPAGNMTAGNSAGGPGDDARSTATVRCSP